MDIERKGVELADKLSEAITGTFDLDNDDPDYVLPVMDLILMTLHGMLLKLLVTTVTGRLHQKVVLDKLYKCGIKYVDRYTKPDGETEH